MLPTKGRRNIIIDGVTWNYVIQGYVSVICHNPETGELIKWYHDVKPKWQTQIPPKLVEEIIRTKGHPAGWEGYPKPKKYITTTLPYANSVPHIGHAFEFIIGDAIARYYRGKLGDANVHFNIGLDEHGKKIWDASFAAGKPVKQYLDELDYGWKIFCTTFDIQYNSFYRTSNKKHYALVERFWEDCKKKGFIYKKQYQGKYCVGCESFKLDKDLVDGKCEDHPGTEIQSIEEENYFFTLSKFRKELTEWFNVKANLKPANKKEELKNIIEDIQDISISRKREVVPWGIMVPGDSTQTIYVWFEALLNYILIIGYYDEKSDFKEYWKDSVQIFGPDNLKFQGAIFQGLLSAAGVEHTGALLCHGTILDKEGKKMSKTVGNVIDPIDQFNKYGIDAVRYYALAGLRTYGNSGWDEEQLVNIYNAHLADNYGNLLTRVVHLINLKSEELQNNLEKFDFDNYIVEDKKIFEAHFINIKNLWDEYDISEAIAMLNSTIREANLYITERQPWSKNAENPLGVLATLYWILEEATLLYFPVIPNKANKALNSLYNFRKEIVFPKIELKQAVKENS